MNLERKMFATARHGEVEFHICVIGPAGAVEFHFWTFPDRWEPEGRLSSLGVESHRRCAPEDANRPACYLLDGDPCCHDGTSLWAGEYVMPLFMKGGSDAVYPVLERRYRQQFEGEATI